MKIPAWLRFLVAPALLDMLVRVKLSAADVRRLTDPDGIYRLSVEQVEAVQGAFRAVLAARIRFMLGMEPSAEIGGDG